MQQTVKSESLVIVKEERAAMRKVSRQGMRRKMAAAMCAGAIVAASPVAASVAFAEGGGSSSNSGGYGSDDGGKFSRFYDAWKSATDHSPAQGTMRASIDYFVSGKLTKGDSLAAGETDSGLRDAIYQSCTDALNRAEARNPHGKDGKSRVVGLMWANGGADRPSAWSGHGSLHKEDITSFITMERNSGYKGLLTQAQIPVGYSKYVASFEQGATDITATMPYAVTAACIALNSSEPPSTPPTYPLTLTTDKKNPFTIAGGTSPVSDTIHASYPDKKLATVTGTISLHWDGVAKNPKAVSKKTVIATNGDTISPQFTPTDFGWASWPSGQFWFDVQVPKQGSMNNPVDTTDRDPRETWTVRPIPPTKNLYKAGNTTPLPATDVLAAGQRYDTRIAANSNGYTQLRITDTINLDTVWVGNATKDDKTAVFVEDTRGTKIPATITIDRSQGGKVVVNAVVTAPVPGMTYTLVVPTFTRVTGKNTTIPDTGTACYGANFTTCLDAGKKQTSTVTPTPNKVWVLDRAGGLTYADPTWTNTVGADQKMFTHGDTVGAVVNGHIPAHLTHDLTSYQIVDDWTRASSHVNFTNASTARVFADGKDVTSQFTITNQGTTTVAQARPEFLATTGGLTADKSVKLILTGSFYPVTDKTDTNGELVTLYNSGYESWNRDKKPTNTPPVFIWNPNPSKDVLSSADQGGDQSSINRQMVFPGQKIEYLVNVDVNIPKPKNQMAYPVKKFQVRDVYDPQFVLNKTSIEFYDARTNTVIPRSQYSLEFDDHTNSFTASFTQSWIDTRLHLAQPGDLLLRMDGVIKPDTTSGYVVKNQAFETINNSVTATNIPIVRVPKFTPDKEDLNTDLANIDGKTVIGGETLLYRLTLDARPGRSQLAYDVHKLGIIDDFDHDYLSLDAKKVRVVDQDTGRDVTARFTVQVCDGVAYVFARQVDSVNVNGQKIPGNPQPADMKAYSSKAINPVTDPIIDQSLLGHQYWVYLPMKVTKVTDGYVIRNQAVENFENMVKKTRIVSNPEKEISPAKDVTITVGGSSVNNGAIRLNHVFNYRLDSSVLPADRAEKTRDWSIMDDYNEKADRYTGKWVAVATRDLYNGATLVAKKGDTMASDTTGKDPLLTVTDTKGVLTVSATTPYVNMLNTRLDREAGWAVYVQMERLTPGTISNTFTETYNSVPRHPHPVRTTTPEHPAIDIEKWDTASGAIVGDRDTASRSLTVTAADATAPIPLTFVVTNTGDVPLTNVAVTDLVTAGHGVLSPLSCPPALADGLDVGETVTCSATLTGLAAGEQHTDRATVTGRSVYTGTTVSDHDDWNALTQRAALPQTGATLAWIAGAAAGLLLLGAGSTVLSRRRPIAR